MDDIAYTPEMPRNPRPVFVIGAGGIVRDAHLPAYRLAGFPVEGILDLDKEKATDLAGKFGIRTVFDDLREMIRAAPPDVVYDMALPAHSIIRTLQQLPRGAAVLIQKPMGGNLEEAKEILRITREKGMTAGVNFQLRYAPFINAARYIIRKGWIGPLHDVEINVNVQTPWHLWTFLNKAPRLEILYHSIHYIDLVRNLLGEPESIYARTTRHPLTPDLAAVRSSIIMDYGEFIRANILTNHTHDFHSRYQQAYIKLEGAKGAIRIHLGLLMNYPEGGPDKVEYIIRREDGKSDWEPVPMEGSWFPHAFIGSMAQVMAAAEGSIDKPDNSAEDALHTMACVEAAYQSSAMGGVRPDGLM
jgi:predicted dehydrogenase